MSLSLLTGQILPETTETEAYVGNSVVNVFMSFNPEDLTDEGLARLGTRAGDGSTFFLKGGSQDSSITAFNVDYQAGEKKNEAYSVEIINPTLELEIKLLAYYDAVFPSDKPSYQTLAAAENERRKMQNEDEIAGTITYADLQPKVPRIFLRFGYGDKVSGGSSRIIGTLLTDLTYEINANRDKTATLRLTDQFTYFSTSKIFNNRISLKKIPILNPDNTLKRPSEILKACLGDFTTVFPGNLPWITLQGKDKYDSYIDSAVFRVAKQLKNFVEAPSEELGFGDLFGIRPTISFEELEQLEGVLSTPIKTKPSRNYNLLKDAPITTAVLLQAYELFFKELGLGFEDGVYHKPKDVVKTLSMLQTGQGTDDTTNTGQNQPQTQKENAQQAVKEDTLVTLPDAIEGSQAYIFRAPGNTRAEKLGWLSYWPKCWEKRPRQPDQGTTFADVYSPGIRPQKIGFTLSAIGGGLEKKEIEAFKVYFNGAGNKFGVLAPDVSSLAENSYQNDSGLFFEVPGGPTTLTGSIVKFKDLDGMPDIEDFEGYVYIDGMDGLTRLTNETGQSLGGLQTSGLILIPSTSPNPEGNTGQDYLSPITPDDFRTYPWVNEVADSNGGKLVSTDFLRGNVERDAARVLRDMTVEEKKEAESLGQLPIWLKPGVWNVNKEPHLERFTGFDGNEYNGVASRYVFKSEFSLTELGALINPQYFSIAKNAFDNNNPALISNLKPLNVEIHTELFAPQDGLVYAKYGNNQEFGYVPVETETGVTTLGPLSKAPLYDLETKALVHGWETNADGTYRINSEIQKYADEIYTWALIAGSPRYLGQFCSTLELEPTIETAEILQSLAVSLSQTVDEFQGDDEPLEMPESSAPEDTEQPERDIPYQGYVTIGTQGAAPNITKTFYNLLNAINNFIIGTNNKIVAAPLHLDRLAPSELEHTVSRLFAGAEEFLINSVLRQKPTILLIGPGATLSERFFEDLTRPITSFPEITQKRESIDEIDRRTVFLNFGTENSIITDLTFDAGTRYLSELMSVYVGILGLAQLEDIGDLENTSRKTIYALVSHGVVKEDSGLSSEEVSDLRNKALRAMKEAPADDELKVIINGESDVIGAEFIPKDVAEYFSLLDPDFIQDESMVALQKFYNVTTDNDTLKNFFYKDDADNVIEKSYEVEVTTTTPGVAENVQLGSGASIKVETNTVTLPRTIRFVNFNGLYKKMADVLSKQKITDTKYQFMKAMRDFTWSVEITTLGIPEISIVTEDMGSDGRKIVLTVFDVRNDLNAPHWLSGIYTILGMNHSINTTDGYTSTFKLVREGPHPTFAKEIING